MLKKATITILVPLEMKAKLFYFAKRRGLTASAWIRPILKNGMNILACRRSSEKWGDCIEVPIYKSYQNDNGDFWSEIVTIRGRLFGRWLFDPSSNSLTYLRERKIDCWDGYEIALDSCQKPNEILNWVSHLSTKVWVTTTVLGHFCFALREIARRRDNEKN